MRLPVTLMSRDDLQELTKGMNPGLADELWTRHTWQGVNLTMRSPAGDLLACGGMQLFWVGVAEAWLHVTPAFARYRFSGYRTLRRCFVIQIEALRLRRVQCAILTDDAKALRLARHLGFRPEGIMHLFDPQGRDAALYALTRKVDP